MPKPLIIVIDKTSNGYLNSLLLTISRVCNRNSLRSAGARDGNILQLNENTMNHWITINTNQFMHGNQSIEYITI